MGTVMPPRTGYSDSGISLYLEAPKLKHFEAGKESSAHFQIQLPFEIEFNNKAQIALINYSIKNCFYNLNTSAAYFWYRNAHIQTSTENQWEEFNIPGGFYKDFDELIQKINMALSRQPGGVRLEKIQESENKDCVKFMAPNLDDKLKFDSMLGEIFGQFSVLGDRPVMRKVRCDILNTPVKVFFEMPGLIRGSIVNSSVRSVLDVIPYYIIPNFPFKVYEGSMTPPVFRDIERTTGVSYLDFIIRNQEGKKLRFTEDRVIFLHLLVRKVL